MQVRPPIAELLPLLISWRRQIHQFPELGFREHKTSAFIATNLRQWGWQVETGVAKTGVVAVWPGNRSERVLAFRADMDALAMKEDNAISYRSQHEGVMHACGHDGHTAILLGLAKYLASHPAPGTIKLIFQPAEEGPGGALPMIEAGVLGEPSPDVMIGLHLWNNLALGTVGVKTGPMMANSDRFRLTIIGKGGHGAMPQQTIDAIVVAAQVVTTLQTIVSRNVNPLQSAVVTIGQIHAGTAFNIIAPSAELVGTVRCFEPELAAMIPQRLEQIIQGVCAAFGATYQLDYQRGYPAVWNDPRVTTLVTTAAEQTLGEGAVVLEQTLGGEDMAYFLQKVPGCYFFLGSANAALGLDKPHHHPCFDFDEQALGLGVELFTRCMELYFAEEG